MNVNQVLNKRNADDRLTQQRERAPCSIVAHRFNTD